MSFALTSLRMSAGVIVWSLHFATIYGLTALACARGVPRPVPWIVFVATLAAGAACVGVIVRERRRQNGFESWLTLGLTAAALLAIVWEALAAAVVPPCA